MKAKRLFLLLTVVGMTTMSYGGTIPESFGCDSIITLKDGVKHSKEVFRYDEWGNAVYYAPYKWEANGWKDDDTKQYVEYKYDADGNRIVWIYASWDNEAGDWIKYLDKWEYTYDEHNNQTTETCFSWDKETNSYVDYLRRKYEYNAQGKVTSRIAYLWNKTDGAWNNNPSYKNEYEYDTQGNLLLDVRFSWSSSRWDMSIPRIEYTYDAQGRKMTEIYYNRSRTSGGTTTYTDGYRDEWEYDAQGRKTSCSRYVFSTQVWQTTPAWKEQYTYDTRGNNTVMEYTGGSVTSNYKYTYGYDTANKKVSTVYSGSKEVLLGYVFNPPVPHYLIVSDYTWQTAHTYDARNRLKTETTLDIAYEVQVDESTVTASPFIWVKTYYYSGGSNGIEPVVTGDDAVVSICYYDLQGMIVAHPQSGRIYIAKETHRSGKVTIGKIMKN